MTQETEPERTTDREVGGVPLVRTRAGARGRGVSDRRFERSGVEERGKSEKENDSDQSGGFV
jgi:hypothetical protein